MYLFYTDRDSFYQGRVFGEADSDVRAHLEDNGVMTATIRTGNETYHIEVIFFTITMPRLVG